MRSASMASKRVQHHHRYRLMDVVDKIARQRDHETDDLALGLRKVVDGVFVHRAVGGGPDDVEGERAVRPSSRDRSR